MKNCLVCQWSGEPPEWSCPCCGEASWSETEEMSVDGSEPAQKPARKSKKAAAQEVMDVHEEILKELGDK